VDLQACIEHVEDGDALQAVVDQVNVVATDSVSILDKLVRGEDALSGGTEQQAHLDTMIQDVKQSIASAINALVDSAVQTGGVKASGKVVGGAVRKSA
jgi:ABC-type cobalamin transport system ATPase subunit